MPSSTGEGARAAGRTDLFRNLFHVGAVGAIDISFSIAANIFFPRAVAKEEYAAYRLYLLYVGYAGVLHFGLLDGLYLRIVGRQPQEVSTILLSQVRGALLSLQVLISLAVLPMLLRFDVPDASLAMPLVLVGTVAATNLLTFYTFLLQATNNFGSVAWAVGTSRATGAVVAIALILSGGATALWLSLCQFVPVAVAAGWLARRSTLMRWGEAASGGKTTWVALPPLWRAGATLFLGNLSVTLALTMGTLMASIVLERRLFADFAFAAGLASVMVVGFEWLATAAAPLHVRLVESGTGTSGWETPLLALMWLAPMVYWGAVIVVRGYLPAYLPALAYLAWFAASLPFIGIVRTRAGTVCRALGRQDVFLKLGLYGAAVVGGTMAAAWALRPSAASIAVGWTIGFAVMGSVVWLLVARAGRLPALRVDAVLVASAVAVSITFSIFRSLPNRALGLAAYLAVGVLGFELARRGLARGST
jgi:hypothetical protein